MENSAIRQGFAEFKSSKAYDNLYAAESFNRSVACSYPVTASAGLNVRDPAGNGKVPVVIPGGTVVRNYGYYSVVNGYSGKE